MLTAKDLLFQERSSNYRKHTLKSDILLPSRADILQAFAIKAKTAKEVSLELFAVRNHRTVFRFSLQKVVA